MDKETLQEFVDRIEGISESKSSEEYWLNSKENISPYEINSGTTRLTTDEKQYKNNMFNIFIYNNFSNGIGCTKL